MIYLVQPNLETEAGRALFLEFLAHGTPQQVHNFLEKHGSPEAFWVTGFILRAEVFKIPGNIWLEMINYKSSGQININVHC